MSHTRNKQFVPLDQLDVVSPAPPSAPAPTLPSAPALRSQSVDAGPRLPEPEDEKEQEHVAPVISPSRSKSNSFFTRNPRSASSPPASIRHSFSFHPKSPAKNESVLLNIPEGTADAADDEKSENPTVTRKSLNDVLLGTATNLQNRAISLEKEIKKLLAERLELLSEDDTKKLTKHLNRLTQRTVIGSTSEVCLIDKLKPAAALEPRTPVTYYKTQKAKKDFKESTGIDMNSAEFTEAIINKCRPEIEKIEADLKLVKENLATQKADRPASLRKG